VLSFDGLTSIANGLQGVQGAGEDFLAHGWTRMDMDKKRTYFKAGYSAALDFRVLEIQKQRKR
jgi:hypothetical protein